MDTTTFLWDVFLNNPTGFCGQGDPARALTQIPDLETRLSVITFANLLPSPDYSVLVTAHTAWLFEPSEVAYRRSQDVLVGFRDFNIVTPKHIARVWWQITRSVQGRFQGSFVDFLASQGSDALLVKNYLQRSKTAFPVLSGPVISACWLDMVHRMGGVTLLNWEMLSVPLSKQEQAAMREWGSMETASHPSLRLALRTWQRSCQSLKGCELEKCPRARS